MKLIKNTIIFIALGLLIASCASITKKGKDMQNEDPVVIANDSLEYEITIIDIGFNNYLNAVAQPRGFYNEEYLEARNRAWVITWNQRAMNTNRYNPNIYENIIDYQQNINYGYEVNYLLFNYFLFAQRKYNMSLGGGFRSNRIN